MYCLWWHAIHHPRIFQLVVSWHMPPRDTPASSGTCHWRLVNEEVIMFCWENQRQHDNSNNAYSPSQDSLPWLEQTTNSGQWRVVTNVWPRSFSNTLVLHCCGGRWLMWHPALAPLASLWWVTALSGMNVIAVNAHLLDIYVVFC